MIQVICFSRARPLQLHGYLTSLYEQWSGDFTVSVLAKIDPEYYPAYKEATAAAEFSNLKVVYEEDFATTLNSLIGDAEFTCFGCDDAVYVKPVSTAHVELAFKMPLLGLSLRLGQNVTQDMWGAPLTQPRFDSNGRAWLYWDFTKGTGDWGYPWEVLGTVYRTEFVKNMMAAIVPGSPSQLEERGSHCWGQHTDLRHMAAYPTSRLVVPTVNVVQNEFPNGIRGTKVLEPEFLLDCWNHGLRMDTKRYAGMQPESWRVPEFYLRRAA